MEATERIVLALTEPLSAGVVERLCAELVGRLRETGADRVVCRIGPGVRPDLAAVDALARLHLVARRYGCRLVVPDPGEELHALCVLVGLPGLLDGGRLLDDVQDAGPTGPGA